jgi:ketose-bisphosphate aldolase
MLVTSKELLQEARAKKFAIPSTNFFDQLSIKAYTEVAAKLKLPIILGYAEVHGKYLSLEEAVLLGKYYGEKLEVPAVLHLDHGVTPSLIRRAVDLGFTSVMIDASQKSFAENVEKTKEIVAYAHNKGVVVEAEIGHVGTGITKAENADDSIYTSVEEAVKFAELTEVDSLAISIGTAHGSYRGTPVINFKRLKEIAGSMDTILVLHGGSSSGDDNLEKCVLGGISKINLFTDFILAGIDNVKKGNPESYFDMKNLAKQAMKDCLQHYYKVFHTDRYNA